MSNRQSGVFMGGVLLGAAIGAGLALAFAPGKGSDTVRRFSDGLEDFGDEAADRVAGAKHSMEQGARRVGEKFKSGADAVRRKADEATSRSAGGI